MRLQNKKLTPEVVERSSVLVRSLMVLLEFRDPYSVGHCALVAQYCVKLSRYLNFDGQAIQRLTRSAEIHTLGVLLQVEEKQMGNCLPTTLLAPPPSRDFSIPQRESELLTAVISDLPYFEGCLSILHQRHEWFDGSGSFHGLSGEAIRREARVLSLIEAFVDLVTAKAHRPGESIETALNRLKQSSAKKFDPTCLSALESMLSEDGLLGKADVARAFESAQCYYFLWLGNFYSQVRETDLALRLFLSAEKVSQRMEDSISELTSIEGQVVICCERGLLGKAREILQAFKKRECMDEHCGLYFQLLWGMVEWLADNRLGEEIVDHASGIYRARGNFHGLCCALMIQSFVSLIKHGVDHEIHHEYLKAFLGLGATRDVLDLMLKYRPYSIPCLVNALRLDIESQLARNLLGRMGEPCADSVIDRLGATRPERWSSLFMASPLLLEDPEAQAARPGEVTISIATLGTVDVTFRAQTLSPKAWKTKKILKVFLFLAVHGGAVSNERLADEFWPDTSTQKSRDSLRNALCQVRRTIRLLTKDPRAPVISRRRIEDLVGLQIPCELDFVRFQKTAESALAASQQGDLKTALLAAREGLALYKGEFLPGIHDDWAQVRRFALADIYHRLLNVYGCILLKNQDYNGSILVARQLLALDDLREEAHALLIEAQAREGRVREATLTYHAAVRHFESELGVVPASLEALVRTLKISEGSR